MLISFLKMLLLKKENQYMGLYPTNNQGIMNNKGTY